MTTGTYEVNYVSWCQQFADGTGVIAHTVCPMFYAEPGTERKIESFLMRIQSYFAIDNLPDRALNELVDTLRDMAEYYSRPPIPERPSIPAKTIKAKLGKSYVRPHLTITED